MSGRPPSLNVGLVARAVISIILLWLIGPIVTVEMRSPSWRQPNGALNPWALAYLLVAILALYAGYNLWRFFAACVRFFQVAPVAASEEAVGERPLESSVRHPVRCCHTSAGVIAALALIGLLAVAIMIPRLAIGKRPDHGEPGATGNLGAIRSALSIYYGDMEGQYPGELAALTVSGKYLATIPVAKPRTAPLPTFIESLLMHLSPPRINMMARWQKNIRKI